MANDSPTHESRTHESPTHESRETRDTASVSASAFVPPRLSRLLVRLLGPPSHREYLIGDLDEGYLRRAHNDRRAARRWYRSQVLQAIRFRSAGPRGYEDASQGGLASRRSGSGAGGPHRQRDVLSFLEGLGRDLRHGLRALRTNPGLSAVVIVSLALGIGANTAIFTVVDALILRPLPVADPEELVQVTTTSTRTDLFTNPQWEALRDGADLFDGAFAVSDTTFELTRPAGIERILGAWVSGEFFQTLGLRAAAGRLVVPADDERGCPAITVLGHDFWRREYGADPAVLGTTIALNGHAVEIIGVAPEGFRGMTAGQAMQVYMPLCAEPIIRAPGSMLDGRSIWSLRVVARQPDGVSMQTTTARLAGLAPSLFAATLPPRWEGERRDTYLGATFAVRPAATGLSRVRDEHRESLMVLLAVVAVVMLVACANVATLLLARGSARQREMAMRVAVGAGRTRLVAQTLIESLLLAVIGAAVGLLFARWASGLLVTMMSSRWVVIDVDLSLDPRVLGFTVGLAILTGLLFGLPPALRALRVDPRTALSSGGRGGTGAPALAAGRAFVVVQVALSLVLVSGAVLLAGSFWRLETLDPGFDRRGVLLAETELRRDDVAGEDRRQLFLQLLDRLREVPGVLAAGASDNSPISGSSARDFFVADGAGGDASQVEIYINTVSDGYFDALGTRLLAGSDFGATDGPGGEEVAIINAAAARELFGDPAAVGRAVRRRLGDSQLGDPIRVVGVVEDAKYNSLREEPPPTIYLSLRHRESLYSMYTLELRAEAPPAALLPVVQAAGREIDPRFIVELHRLDEQVADSIGTERLMAVLSSFFGGLALLLAAIGLYGVMSYNVARRGREIAVRMALGARRGDVLGLVLGETGRLLIYGAIAGGLASLAATRLIAAFLYGSAPADPVALLSAAALLIVVGLAAGLLPARRAAGCDPVVMLRGD